MLNPRVLIIGEDAPQFASLVAEGAPSIDIATARDAEEALGSYDRHEILFGSPDHIAKALPDMPEVRWVQSTWAGVKPLVQLGRHDYVLTGVKDVFGPQMAEYVIGYLLAHELMILRRLEAQQQHTWWPGQSGAFAGKTLGIMGAGSIGRAIAAKARALGVIVIGYSRSGTESPEFDSVYPASHLAEFLGRLDYLVSVLPDTPATDRLLDAESLGKLPAHAFLINVGRGNTVDDVALMAALNEDRLAGAVLDVFDEEPVPPDSPLWDTKNLLMTAHMAAVSDPQLIAPIFLENYRRFVAGRDLLHVISFDQGY